MVWIQEGKFLSFNNVVEKSSLCSFFFPTWKINLPINLKCKCIYGQGMDWLGISIKWNWTLKAVTGWLPWAADSKMGLMCKTCVRKYSWEQHPWKGEIGSRTGKRGDLSWDTVPKCPWPAKAGLMLQSLSKFRVVSWVFFTLGPISHWMCVTLGMGQDLGQVTHQLRPSLRGAANHCLWVGSFMVAGHQALHFFLKDFSGVALQGLLQKSSEYLL